MGRWSETERERKRAIVRELAKKGLSVSEIREVAGIAHATARKFAMQEGYTIPEAQPGRRDYESYRKTYSAGHHRPSYENRKPRFTGVQEGGVPVLQAKPWQCKFRLPGYDLQGSARCCGNSVDPHSILPYCVGHVRAMRKRDEQN